MEKLFEIQNLLIEQHKSSGYYERECFANISLNNRMTGLMGPRGIGKTTFLVHQAMQHDAKKQQALYVSTDNYYFLKTPLIELVDKLHKETNVRLLCLDEIQKYQNWNQELKNIYDTYKDFKILFTGSSMIDIIKSKYDLSRRVCLHQLHGFSFREYLEYCHNIKLPIITLDEIINNHLEIAANYGVDKVLMLFNEYLQSGYYPFFNELSSEIDKFQAIENSVQKVIYEDIATLHSLKTSTMLTIEKLYKFIATSIPGELSVYKLASTLKKDFDSVSEYLSMLKNAGLIRFIFTDKTGKAMLRNPTKLYPDNTNLIFSNQMHQNTDDTRGKIRETFVINHLENSSVPIFYSKTGDFKVDKYTIEIGGKNKTFKQLKGISDGYVFADGITIGFGNKIPLYLLGFLY